MRRLLAAFLLAVLLAWASPALALDVPALSGRVNDLAGMMSPAARSQVEAILADLERTDSTQVAVLTVPTLAGGSLEEFSLRAAEKWRLGQKGRDNGALIVVAQAERRMRIEVGYGLEGRLTDLLAGRIIDNVMRPRFKAGDFDGGFVAAAQAVAQAVRGEFKAEPQRRRSSGGGGLGFIALLLVFGVLSVLSRLGGMARPASRVGRGGGFGPGPFIFPGGFGGGGGGGGFGGFSGGGGGFGGGGASGGW